MINVSSEFKTLMETRTDFRENADITLTDGTVLNLSESDFTISNNSITDGAGANTFPLGVAVCRGIQIELANQDDHLSSYDFFGAKIRLYLTFQLSTTVEKIEMGTFTVTEPETYGQTVIIIANDDMYKADKPFETALSFPVSAQVLLQDVCVRCGIPLFSTTFDNGIFPVANKPSGNLTYRQVIGYIAMIGGGNARINRSGYLEIIPYSFNFSTGNYHSLSNWKSGLSIGTSDITITGVQTTRDVEAEDGTEEETVFNGTEGYVLSVENPLAAGSEEDLLAYLASIFAGVSFRKFEGEHIAYPLAEFMDLAEFTDRKGNTYRSVITDIDFAFFGFTTLKNSAEDGLRNESTYPSTANKAIIAARKLVQKESTARELAVEKLNETFANASGMFPTEVTQPDGSTITYLHDKPTLEESQNVLKFTAEAIGLSTDGGETYPYGVTVDGETIMRIVRAEGIEADWVKIGSKTVAEVIQAIQTTAEETDQNLSDFSETVTASLEDLQNQIDGAIVTWFYDYEPTIDNYPASEWIATEAKNQHLGDLFYIVDNEDMGGLVYRWALINGVYGWQLVEDAEVAKAMAAAAQAQDTADGKRRVFVTTPTPPYDLGDLWSQGSTGDLMVCVTAKANGGIYAASDWQTASKYTDDTSVDILRQTVTEKFSEFEVTTDKITAMVEVAQSTADSAKADIDILASTTTQKIAELNITAENISTSVSQQSQDIDGLKERMTAVDQNAESVKIQIQAILDNGVDKVTTETGYTFNSDGLRISKSGEEMDNKLDNTGMYVTRSGEPVLQANNAGVIAADVTVNNYLTIGHARFEAYGTDRTACFYV